MKELFAEYPMLESDRVLLRKLRAEDAEALQSFMEEEAVYPYLPKYLYERNYTDAEEVIARVDEECFVPGKAILLAVCLQEEKTPLVGIAEIYHYEPGETKASIGCRLRENVWGQGIATRVARLLRDYLVKEIGLKTITAHIMQANTSSAKAARKVGFVCEYPNIYEDWGFSEPVLVDQYVFRQEWLARCEEEGVL
ncbi:MAG: GNAT family N-acetyltransferase [Eubacterium sp.]|nr:GNAT family N-acetyltransferase [Eubacterium sp.]